MFSSYIVSSDYKVYKLQFPVLTMLLLKMIDWGLTALSAQ